MTRLLSVSSVVSAGLIAACSPTPVASPPAQTTAKVGVDSIVTGGAKTKIAAFTAKTGAVIIQGFTEVGKVPGLYGGEVAIDAKEFTNAADGSKVYGVTVEVKVSGAIDRDNTSYVDFDELESLLKGIDYIAKIDKSVTRLASFQADYRTKGDLGFSTFNVKDGQTLVAVKSGTIGGAQAFFKLADLGLIRSRIAAAMAKLDSLRQPPKQ